MSALFVTGATGFVGRHVVNQAAAAGHQVRALVRPSSTIEVLSGAIATGNVQVVRGDLARPSSLDEGLAGADVIVHLAAVKGGDFSARFSGTVVGTENLLERAGQLEVSSLVAVSTFSVYDYSRSAAGSLFDESFPELVDPAGRDEYAETKFYQDELYRAFGEAAENRMVMIRPAMIYGPSELWHPLLGGELGPLNVRVGRGLRPPITYVENAAEAIVLAAERLLDPTTVDDIDGQVINIVDDDLPTQAEYVSKVRAVVDAPSAVVVPWPVMRAAARAGEVANRQLFGGRAKLPSLAVPAQLDARFKPFRYSNAKAKRLLGWTPRYDLDTALRRSAASEAGLRRSAASEAGLRRSAASEAGLERSQ